MQLSGNKIIITGASDGIGKSLATKFIELGNNVIAVSKNQDKLLNFTDLYEKAIPFCADLSKSTELDRLTLFIEQHHSDTNIIINNAGIQYNYDFTETDNILAKIDHEIAINLVAPIKLTALLLPVLEQNKNAAIINVSSGLGLVPKQQAPVYCGTKAGLHMFTKAFRYQSEKVKVFEIIPPLVDTEMTKGRGKGKISAEKLVEEFIRNFKNDNFEINIGKVKLLRFINRIAPRLADRIMRNGL